MEQSNASSKRVPSKLSTLPRSQYEDLIRPAKRALEQLELDLKWYLEDIGNRTVHHIKTRVKEYSSLLRKLQNGKYASVDEITDIAGMRIVVHGKTDVEAMVALFKGQEIRKDVEILEDVCRKDESGYAGRQLVVRIRPSYKRSAFAVKIEVQIRTLAEDLFDTLSRAMWYKPIITTPRKSDDLTHTLVQKLREVDEIVDRLREEWEDTYAQTSVDSDITPHSFRRIVAELFHEEIAVDDAVENVRFLRDRGVKLNKHLRSIFTSAEVRSKVNRLASLQRKVFGTNIFGKANSHELFIRIVCYPKIVEMMESLKPGEGRESK